jgi:hypothetical protein
MVCLCHFVWRQILFEKEESSFLVSSEKTDSTALIARRIRGHCSRRIRGGVHWRVRHFCDFLAKINFAIGKKGLVGLPIQLLLQTWTVRRQPCRHDDVVLCGSQTDEFIEIMYSIRLSVGS